MFFFFFLCLWYRGPEKNEVKQRIRKINNKDYYRQYILFIYPSWISKSENGVRTILIQILNVPIQRLQK